MNGVCHAMLEMETVLYQICIYRVSLRYAHKHTFLFNISYIYTQEENSVTDNDVIWSKLPTTIISLHSFSVLQTLPFNQVTTQRSSINQHFKVHCFAE